MIGRRSFLAGILGAAAAPAIVKAESLMKLSPLERTIRFRRWAPGKSGLATLLDGEIGGVDQFRILVSPLYDGVTPLPNSLAYMERELRKAMQPSPFRLVEPDLLLDFRNAQHRKTA